MKLRLLLAAAALVASAVLATSPKGERVLHIERDEHGVERERVVMLADGGACLQMHVHSRSLGGCRAACVKGVCVQKRETFE